MTKTSLHISFSTLITKSLVILSLGFSAGYANPSTQLPTVEKTSPSTSPKESIVVSVKGMVCDFCAQGLKKSFTKKGDVDSIHVSLKKGLVTIYPQTGQKVSDDIITKGIRDNGISVDSIQRTPLLETP
jgi:copper chaperone CopZ